MYTRWVSVYEFRWTPILTYTRRHLQLLDWLEANIEPVAFIDEPGKLGIALGAADLRLTVQRNGMTLDSGMSGLSVTELLPAVAGVFEVLEPNETVLTAANIISSVELPGADYEEARRVFAQRIAGGGTEPLAGRAVLDASILTDLTSESSTAQVEWGIVKAKELLFRLSQPRLSRISKAARDDRERVRQLSADAIARGVPDVSMFVEHLERPGAEGDVTDSESVGAVIVKVEDIAERLAIGFAGRYEAAEKSAKEETAW